MSITAKVGSSSKSKIPLKSLGVIFYEKLKKWNPNRVVLIDSEEKITYGSFLKQSVQIAKQLQNMGVKKGDVITIVAQNQWKIILTIIAGFYIGATINLLNHDYTSGELKHFLSICKPVCIFCTNKTLNHLQKLHSENFPLPRMFIYDAETSNLAQGFNLLLEHDNNEIFNPVELDPVKEVALILTSSGTTGFPKCVQLTHYNFRATMTYATDPSFLDLNEFESTLAFLPIFHVFGCAIALASIYAGTKAVILDKFIPDKFLCVIQEHQISKLFVVPPILHFLVKSPLVQKFDISSITDVLCGASAVSKELEEMVQQKLKVKSVRQIYGMTELCGAATMIPKKCQQYGSSGKVVNGHEIKVCHIENGKTLPANQIGELRVKGDGVMKGYLNNEEESKQAFDEDGFLKTGDLGYYDEEGFFYIVDRLKEIIKYKGFQVSPAELENLLIQHPAVKDAGVIGIPDDRAGELPLAFIVKQDENITEEELIQYVSEHMSVQKNLHGGVRFVDSIPKNSSGKILRRKLKELL